MMFLLVLLLIVGTVCAAVAAAARVRHIFPGLLALAFASAPAVWVFFMCWTFLAREEARPRSDGVRCGLPLLGDFMGIGLSIVWLGAVAIAYAVGRNSGVSLRRRLADLAPPTEIL